MHQARLASLLALACTAALIAQDPVKPAAESTPAATVAKPKASELLTAALKFTQSLPSLAIKAKGTMILPELPEEMAAQFEDIELPILDLELVIAAPNRFVLRCDEEGLGEVVCDGKQLLRTFPQFQLHSLAEAPKHVLDLLGKSQGMLTIPAASNLRALLAPAGGKGALLDAKTVELLGEGKVGGKDAWHLAVRDDQLACEVWVQKGNEPWVLRHKPKARKLDLTAMMGGGEGEDEDATGGAGAGDGEGLTINLEPGIDLEVVTVSKELAKDVFALKPPTDSKQVDDLAAAVQERFQEQMAEMGGAEGMDEDGDAEAEGGHGKVHETVGKPAPDVELTLLDGTKQKVADLKGKVVVLDFWATWCGPCVQGLPKVAEVTAKLAEKGVVFHACNLDESKEKIEKFLAKKNLSISVAMVGQELAAKFGVNGIPHTVVIGKDGVVKKVHVGFAPGSEKQLEKDLLEILGASAEEKKDEQKEPPKGEKPAEEKPKDAGGK